MVSWDEGLVLADAVFVVNLFVFYQYVKYMLKKKGPVAQVFQHKGELNSRRRAAQQNLQIAAFPDAEIANKDSFQVDGPIHLNYSPLPPQKITL